MIAGPFLAACALLAVAGLGKVRRPAPARAATAAAGARVPPAAIVAFGAGEVGAAVAGAALGGPAALVVAAFYVVLGGFAIRLLVHAPATPCACLGSPAAPVTPAHVALNGCAAAAAIAASFGGAPLAVAHGHWLGGATFLVLVACCTGLAVLVLEAWPALAQAARKEAT